MGQLTSVAYLVPCFVLLVMLVIDWGVLVHLFHLLFSIPSGIYSIDGRSFSFEDELPVLVLPPVINIPEEKFAV